MARIIRKETRRRGIFGWIFLLLFWGFNILMALWMFYGLKAVTEVEVSSSAEAAGRAIGGTIGAGMIIFIWVGGAIILGLFTLLTRGSKTIIEETSVER